MPRKIETVATEVAANEVTTLRATGAGSGDILTADGSGGSAWAAPAGGGGAGVYASVTTLTNGQSITSAHSGGLVLVDSAAESTLTLANDSAGGWAAGAVLDVMSLGSGRVIIAQGSGVTIAGSATASPIIYRANQRVTLIRVGADAWVAVGSSTMMALGYNGVVAALYPLDGNLDDYTGGSPFVTDSNGYQWYDDSVVAGGKSVSYGSPNSTYGAIKTSFPSFLVGQASSPFTIEMWLKQRGYYGFYNGTRSTGGTYYANNFRLYFDGTFLCSLYMGRNGNRVVNASFQAPSYQWFHFAISVDETTTRAFIDGGEVFSSPNGFAEFGFNDLLVIGREGSSLGLANCFVDQIRISSAALYTENFVPATQLVAL